MHQAHIRTPPRLLLALGWASAIGCAHDRILPVTSVCGDGVVTGSEECDTTSPGCTSCHVTDGWQCTDDTCTPICGDGKVQGGEQCDPPDGTSCNESCELVSRPVGCNLTGYFAVKQTNYSRDTIVNQVQTSSNWYFYRFSQSGSTFQVDQALTCGIHVTGTVDVSLDDGGLAALLYANRQDGKGAHGPRRGTFVPTASGNGCELSFDRWYMVRGVDEPTFLPADFAAHPDLASLPPLPKPVDPLTPAASIPGATDPDGDGLLGLALHLSGNLQGLRSVAQRDWNEVSTAPDAPIAENAGEFTATSVFDSQESVLSVTQCQPAICSLLLAGGVPARDIPGRVKFRYLGQSLSDPAVAAIAASAPGDDVNADLQTCKNVRAAMPHEPYMQ